MAQRKIWITLGFIIVLLITNLYYVGFVIEHPVKDEIDVLLDSMPHDIEPSDLDREISGIQFGFNAAEPILGLDYQSFIDDIVLRLHERDTLQIIGLQYANEDRIGLAYERAEQVSNLFANTIELNQIQVSNKSMTTELQYDELCNGFNYVVKSFVEPTADEANDITGLTYTAYFEENEKSLPVAQYEAIRKALQLPQANFTQEILLIGYGDPRENEAMTLAKKRAWRVKSVIWDLGVDPLLITIQSHVGQNAKEAENRKVEVYLK